MSATRRRSFLTLFLLGSLLAACGGQAPEPAATPLSIPPPRYVNTSRTDARANAVADVSPHLSTGTPTGATHG